MRSSILLTLMESKLTSSLLCDKKEFAGEEVVDVVMHEHHDAAYSVERQYCHMLHVGKISSGKAHTNLP